MDAPLQAPNSPGRASNTQPLLCVNSLADLHDMPDPELPTVAAAVCQMLLVGGFVAVAFMPSKPLGDDDHLVAVHVGLVTLVALLSAFVQSAHRQSQLDGYLSFYRETQLLRSVPLFAVVLSTCAMTVAESVATDALMSITKLVGILELLAVSVSGAVYCQRVLEHNREKPPPDAQKLLDAAFSDLEFHGRPRGNSGVMSAQSDLIHFLSEKVKGMSEQILRLQAGETAPAMQDASYLLAASQRENRVLRQERQQLASELDDLRKAKADVEALNAQQADEAEQLRFERNEEAKRATKLELMLEIEKDANAEAQEVLRRLRG